MLKFDHLKTAVGDAIWRADTATLPAWKALLLWLLRLVYVLARDLAEGQLTLRAMSLVYTSLLSLVPLLAVSFSVLKAFGAHNQLQLLLLEFLAPLGAQGIVVTQRIITFVQNIKVGIVGSVGIALLLYTALSLIKKIEHTINFTWHITEERSFTRRFSSYLTVIVIGPLLVFTALGITATLMNTQLMRAVQGVAPLGLMIDTLGTLLPYALVIAAFTFVYLFVPNTRVKFGCALLGGIVGGILWEILGWGFASFLTNLPGFTAIYAAFAALALFMIWLYLSWLVLLLGSSVAFYIQNPEFAVRQRHNLALSNRLKEKLALQVMQLIGRSFYLKAPPWTCERLAQRLRIPLEVVEAVTHPLEQGQFLVRRADEEETFIPAQPLETTLVYDVLAAMRAAEESSGAIYAHLQIDPTVEHLGVELDEALRQQLAGRTLKDLVMASTPTADETRPADASNRLS